jgi:hypothetical protein
MWLRWKNQAINAINLFFVLNEQVQCVSEYQISLMLKQVSRSNDKSLNGKS